MSAGIGEPDGIVVNIRVSIPALRVGRVGNEAVRLDEAVDIRRKRQMSIRKNKLKVLKIAFR